MSSDMAEAAASSEHAAAGKEEPRLIPEGYEIPPEIVERVKRRMENPELTPFEDPEGIITPGLVLTSPRDPDHRRLVTNMYITPKGAKMVSVHIEGSGHYTNLLPEDLRRKIADGELSLPPSGPEK